ncbi:RNase H domain-containing protein [Trichonephila clavipes]|nr:RNase H domain-containing protein [Trichonephila clavipes]
MKHSPFSYARTLNLPSTDVEPHSPSFTGTGFQLEGIYFHDQLLISVAKGSEIPALVKQPALETINGILQSSLKIYTDENRGHSIHSQWISLHVGIEGNERADFLARTAAMEGVSPRGNLTFSEISPISKLELNRQIKTPPSHAWYFAKCPGESFRLSSRPLQSTYSRFLSGHTRALRFSNGQKTFPECHWCSF